MNVLLSETQLLNSYLVKEKQKKSCQYFFASTTFIWSGRTFTTGKTTKGKETTTCKLIEGIVCLCVRLREGRGRSSMGKSQMAMFLRRRVRKQQVRVHRVFDVTAIAKAALLAP